MNLARDKPAEVSSAEDAEHGGDKAVNGNPVTYWQTARATGGDRLPSEWILVDLGIVTEIRRIDLSWDARYATSFDLEASTDEGEWTTLFSTMVGEGGSQTVSVSPIPASYVTSSPFTIHTTTHWRERVCMGYGAPMAQVPVCAPLTRAASVSSALRLPPTAPGRFLSPSWRSPTRVSPISPRTTTIQMGIVTVGL